MENSRRKSALIAGIGLLVMAAAAAFSYGYVHNGLVIESDPAATLEHLRSSEPLFRAGILGWLLIFLCDVVVAWALYLFLRQVDQGLSLLTAWLRLAYAALLGAGMTHFISILHLLDGVLAFAPEMTSRQILFHLTGFEGVWSMGLIIFGLHLLALGYLAWKADYVPGVWGWLLILAAFCYLAVHGAKLLLVGLEEQVAALEMWLSVPMTVGELGFGIWLIVRGGK